MENTSVVKPTKGEKSTSKNDLFTEDFCTGCGGRFDLDDLEDYSIEDSPENVLFCPKCAKEQEEQFEKKMANFEADELAREQDCGYD